jgi:hypothetical protein
MIRLLLDSENPWITGIRYVAEEPYFIIYRRADGTEGWIPYDDASPFLQQRAREAHESAEAAEREACRRRTA